MCLLKIAEIIGSFNYNFDECFIDRQILFIFNKK